MTGRNDHENGELLRFAKRVGIVCGAMIAAGTVIQAIGGYLWGNATRPIMAQIAEERIARQFGDSLVIGQVAALAQAIREPVGSAARERAASAAVDAPRRLERLKEAAKKNR